MKGADGQDGSADGWYKWNVLQGAGHGVVLFFTMDEIFLWNGKVR